MRAWIFALAGAAALMSLPAHADRDDYGRHGHFRDGGRHGIRVEPYFGFGYSYGYPFDFGFGFPYYYGYPYPFYGFGVQIERHRARKPAQPAQKDSDSAGASALKLYVYPAGGQSEKQTAEDRSQCHSWAVGQSHYDPTAGTGTLRQADDYRRAFTACMEGRNYVVK
jgi:hypothetical protein